MAGPLVVVIGLSALGACDKVPLLAPTGSTITLSSTSSVLPIGGSTDVTATVIEMSGTPAHNGTLVSFTTTLGRVEPVEARTHNGQVTVRFLAGDRSGTAEIRARSGGATSGDAALMMPIGAAGAETVTLTVSPTSLPATGGTVEILAHVSDTSGNALAGVSVSFQTSSGTLSATTAFTDASGFARSTLTTTREAVVTASVPGKTPATFTVSVNAAPTVGFTSVTPAAPGLATTFTVAVQPGTGGPSVQNVTIAFGDGDTVNLGTVTGTIPVSHVYRRSGTVVATVTATDAIGQRVSGSTVVNIPSPAPVSVNITAACSGSCDVGEAVLFTATVTPATAASYFWTFADGAMRTTTGNQTSFVFLSPGVKTIRVVVTMVDGTQGFAETQIVIVGTLVPGP